MRKFLIIALLVAVSVTPSFAALAPEIVAKIGNPRVMIIVDEEEKSDNQKAPKIAPVVEGELSSLFEEAGFLIVDNEQARTLLQLEPKKAFNNPELAAKTVRADVLVVAHAEAGAAHTQRFGIHMYKPNCSIRIKAVLTKTAYQVSSQTISKSAAKWGGSSSASGIIKASVKQAGDEIINKIANRLASASSAIDGITVNIKLAGASFQDMKTLTAFLGQSGQVFERSYSKELTEIDLVSSKNAGDVASLISDYSLPGGKLEIDGQTAQTVSAVIRAATVQPVKPKSDDVKFVEIKVFLDKLGEDEAHKIEYELRKFVGADSQVQGDFQNRQLNITVKIPQGSRTAKDIATFLRDDMKSKGIELLVDDPEGNSVKGSTPKRFLDGLWW